MTPEVLETDDEGNPIVVVYRETETEREARRAEREEQARRAQEVAKSLSIVASDTLHIEDAVTVGTQHTRTGSEKLQIQESVTASTSRPRSDTDTSGSEN